MDVLPGFKLCREEEVISVCAKFETYLTRRPAVIKAKILLLLQLTGVIAHSATRRPFGFTLISQYPHETFF